MTAKTLADGAAELPPGLTPLLSVAQLCAYFGVSRWTVQQWVNEGCPTEPSPTRGHRFKLAHVEAWALERQSANEAEAASA